jgi:hypothetical protein
MKTAQFEDKKALQNKLLDKLNKERKPLLQKKQG